MFENITCGIRGPCLLEVSHSKVLQKKVGVLLAFAIMINRFLAELSNRRVFSYHPVFEWVVYLHQYVGVGFEICLGAYH